MRICVLGNSSATASVIQGLLDIDVKPVAVIGKPQTARKLNSYEIEQFALKIGIQFTEIDNINSKESITYLQSLDCDYLLSTWPDILSEEALRCAKLATIGSHPTYIPRNKGRHPLHWMIVLGISEGAVTLFEMNTGIDTGPILLRTPFSLPNNADIVQAIQIADTAYRQASKDLFKNLRDGRIERQLQSTVGNYWRARSFHDSLIDPRMSADLIIRTVRSFIPPYPCANIIIDNELYQITAGGHLPNEPKTLDYEYGKVISISERTIKFWSATTAVSLELNRNLIDSKVKYVRPPTFFMNSSLF